ncbi:F-box/kelch-repeat protein At3g23880-like [Silene latifolia]|uniref:F-box/kelch-repeat protein At3g23880-like n=1 Tax=Silene latifolia TaxID=37657 RepID=UPI003D7739D7
MSVSKQWYSTLSSSKFTTFHHLMKSPFSHPSSPQNTLFIQWLNEFYLFYYDDDQNPGNLVDSLVKLHVSFGVNDYPKLIGCCNGLVCLSGPFSDYIILWNLAARKLHKYWSDEYLERIHYVTHGFGYVSSVDDYKYVRILTLGWESGQGSNIAHIFSFRESKWRKIEFDHDVIVRPYGKPVLLDEKLYWASYTQHVVSVIVSFNLGLEKFHIIKLNVAYLAT